jgi:hypothetical protein
MRRKPVSLDEVRFNGRIITTAPFDAVRATEYRWGNPIMQLWEPLLRELEKSELGSFVMAFKPCRQCGRKFWRDDQTSGVFCSDRCAALARGAKYAATKGAARAAARSGRRCVCGKPLKAARSTMRFRCVAGSPRIVLAPRTTPAVP